ncbi:MAG: HepT-like ribonuclease domain-containing protein [Bacteroidota bacterium]
MYDKKNIAYILTSLEAIEKLKIYTSSITTPEEFLERNDQMVYNACLTLLMTIGEETKKIEKGLKEEHPEIEWKLFKGLRNRIAHDYRSLNARVSYTFIRKDLDGLKDALVAMVDKIDYPIEKLRQLVATPYYSHLTYLVQ